MSEIDSFLSAKPSGAGTANKSDIDSFLGPAPSSITRRAVGDSLVSALKGAISVPEAAVGLADIPTGGYAGKWAEAAGIRFKDAREAADELYSPEQQRINRGLADTKGFVPTLAYAVQNPSVIAHNVIESAPSMLAGGAVGRGAIAAVPRLSKTTQFGLSPLAAAAIGEGAVSAGQTAEQSRQDLPSGLLTAGQSALAAASGAITGGFNRLGGTVAQKLGLSDVDTALVTGRLAAGRPGIGSAAKRVAGGAFSEGVLEELPQSTQEQVAQNLITGKPWDEGVGQAAAMGALVGGVMGAGANVMHGASTPQTVPPPNAPANQPPAITPGNAGTPAPGASPPPTAAPAVPQVTANIDAAAAPAPVQRDETGDTAHPNDIAARAAVALPGAGPLTQAAATATISDGPPSATEQARLDASVSEAAGEHYEAQNKAIVQQQAALEEADARVQAQRQQQSEAQRRSMLDTILDDQDVRDPVGKMTAELRRAGYQDEFAIPTKDEMATIKRHADVRAAIEAEHVAEGTPNEMDVSALVPEKRAAGEAPARATAKTLPDDLVAAASAAKAQKDGGATAFYGAVKTYARDNLGLTGPALDAKRQELMAAYKAFTPSAPDQQAADAERAKPRPTLSERTAAGRAGTAEPSAAPSPATSQSAALPASTQSVPESGSSSSLQSPAESVAPIVPPAQAGTTASPARPESLQAPTHATGARAEARTGDFIPADDPRQRGHDAAEKGEPRTAPAALSIPARKAWIAGYDGNTFIPPRDASEGPAITVDSAAHEAATSPKNDLPPPTPAQVEAGNFKMGHPTVAGLPITIEHPAGVARKEGWQPLKAHYGYVKRTVGADRENFDVFVRPGTPQDYKGPVFVVDQTDKSGKFDEHKGLIGWPNKLTAAHGYAANYPKGFKVGKVTQMTTEQFKDWLANGDTTKPLAGASAAARANRPKETRTPGKANNATLKRDLQRLGIDRSEQRDITGEPNAKRTGAMPGTFRANGMTIDDWAERLHEDGWLPAESQSERGNEDVRASSDETRDFIRRVLAGEEVHRIGDQQQEAARVAHEEWIEHEAAMMDDVLSPLELADMADSALARDENEVAFDSARFVVESGLSASAQDTILERAALMDGDYEQNVRDQVEASRSRQESGGSPTSEALTLTGETEASIAAREETNRVAAEREAAAAKAEEQKSRADAQRGDFNLTGSDRAADSTPGQGDLLGPPKKGPIGRAGAGVATPLDSTLRTQVQAGASAKSLLSTIILHSKLPLNKAIARMLQKAGVNPTVKAGRIESYKDEQLPKNVPRSLLDAMYEPDTNSVVLFNANTLEHDVLHELAHAAVYAAIERGGLAAAQLKALFEHVKKVNKLYPESYGLTNLHEFIAEAFSSPEFQAELQRIPAKSGLSFGSAWDWFSAVVRNILGLPRESHNALSQVLEVGKQLVQDSRGRDAGAAPLGSISSAAKNALNAAKGLLPGKPPATPAAPVNGASWNSPAPSRLDKLIYTLQDKQVDTRRVIQAINAQSRAIADADDVYLQEELYHGRSAKETKGFIDNELQPLVADMAQRKVSMDDLETYLHNRHAEERNVQIAKINPNLPDAGSGIKTADAQAYLAGLTPARRANLTALAAKVDAINAGTKQLLIAYGLESKSTIAAWDKVYKHYVPLQREDMEGGTGTGQGFSVKGGASKRATGSTLAVENILANLALQRERAIVRGEKNKVANALVGLANANPNPDFWKVDQPPKIKYVDDRTGLVAEMVDPLYKSRENIVMARTPDAAGEIVEHAVVFNERDERAARMAKALKNLDVDQLGEVLGASAKVTRYFAAVNTQFNPIFGIVNVTRDIQGALLNLSTTPIAGKQKQIVQHTVSALKGIYLDERAVRQGKHPTSAWAQEYEEFQREGGATGYKDMFRTSKDRAEAIEREFSRIGEGKFKRFGRAVFDWLGDYNTAMENAVRLAAYKVAKDSGLSKQRAASLAKNLTVNFNRKGQVGSQVGALYAFFNASVQGTARLAETLNGPMGQKIIAGGVMLGAIQALALSAAGFDDDDPPDFVRERNIIIPIGDKKYITIPMPLGLHFIPNIGRVATEFTLSGFKDPGKRVMALANVFADAFNPIGSAGLSLQTIAPTVVDPLAALAENKDWTGKPIAKLDTNGLAPTPGHTRAKDTASYFSKTVSKALNWASGGTNYKPGLFSPTPDQLDYLIGQVTGGVGREAMKLEQSATATVTGEDLPSYKVPLLGRFYGNADQPASQAGKFYENLKKINQHEAEIKGRRKAGEPLGDYGQENPEARLVLMANTMERRVSQLHKHKRELLEKDADSDSVKAVDLQIAGMMRTFNDRVKQVSASAN